MERAFKNLYDSAVFYCIDHFLLSLEEVVNPENHLDVLNLSNLFEYYT